MELNEIKKALYKEKPQANFSHAKRDGLTYVTKLGKDILYFIVPLSEIQDGVFEQKMPAQQLIRWLVTPNL